MLGQLFAKECKQTAKSLIYWLIVLILIFGFTTQLGNNMEIAKEPKPGRASYGYQASRDPEIIMSRTLGKLTEEYFKDLIVVSYNEVDSNVELQSVGMVTA